MSKILITGATGFIGNHVTRMALEAGDKVRVMVIPLSCIGLTYCSQGIYT